MSESRKEEMNYLYNSHEEFEFWCNHCEVGFDDAHADATFAVCPQCGSVSGIHRASESVWVGNGKRRRREKNYVGDS